MTKWKVVAAAIVRLGVIPDRSRCDRKRMQLAPSKRKQQIIEGRSPRSCRQIARLELPVIMISVGLPAVTFLSTHAAVYNIFNVQRHLAAVQTHCTFRATAMSTWREAVPAA